VLSCAKSAQKISHFNNFIGRLDVRVGELTIDLRGIGCPYGSTLAIQHFRDAPVGSVITFLLDDEECYLTLKRLFPLLGQRVVKADTQDKTYRLSILKVKLF
jgi:TusA-related sulfurtransferase